jgi:hypothetical protein
MDNLKLPRRQSSKNRETVDRIREWQKLTAEEKEERKMLEKWQHEERQRRCGIWLAVFLLAAVAADAQPIPSNLVLTPRQDGSVTLAWDASPATNVAGYVVYCGTVSRAYGASLFTTNTTAIWTNLPAGADYFFAVTARARSGLESDFSNEIIWPVFKPPPPVIRTVTLSAVLRSAPSLDGPWRIEQRFPTNVFAATEQRRFWRVEVNAQ